MAYPRSVRSRSWKTATRTAGSVTVTATAGGINIDTALDLVLPAQVGDGIRYTVSGRITTASGSDARFDVATIVSAAIANYFGQGVATTSSLGWNAWYSPNTTIPWPFAGSALRTLVAGDISGGTVTLRLRGVGAGTGAHVISAVATDPLTVWAENIGPASPH